MHCLPARLCWWSSGARTPVPGSSSTRTSPRAGRHPESDIFLDDVTVSRRHAEFRRDRGGVRGRGRRHRSTARTSTASRSRSRRWPTATRCRSASSGWCSCPATRPRATRGHDTGRSAQRTDSVVGQNSDPVMTTSLADDMPEHPGASIGAVLAASSRSSRTSPSPRSGFLESEGLVTPHRTRVRVPAVQRRRRRTPAVRARRPARPVPAVAGDQGPSGRHRPWAGTGVAGGQAAALAGGRPTDRRRATSPPPPRSG